MLNKYLKEYGYRECEIKLILNDYEILNYNETSLLNKIKIINEYLETIFNQEEIIRITSTCPSLYGYNLNYIKNKYLNFINIGYDKITLNKMILKFPNIIIYTSKNIQTKINTLNKLGLDIIKITSKLPQIYAYSNDFIINKYNYLLNLGFREEKLLKIINVYPQILSLDYTNIDKTYNLFFNILLNKDLVIKILSISPQIFGYKEERIINTFNVLKKYNYKNEDILVIITIFPSIFSKSLSSLEHQLLFYQVNNMEEFVLANPKNLIQGINLTYARIKYFLNNQIRISSKNLYLSSNNFFKKYNISSLELINMYPILDFSLENNFKL